MSIGTGTISGTSATFTTSSLPVGNDSITASWPGNGNYGSVTSSPFAQTVRQPVSGQTIYSYSPIYDAVGNVTIYTDSVMGTMNFTYDTLNRLVSATATTGPYHNQYGCWSYDSFGNRLSEAFSTTTCTNNPPLTSWATYTATNTNRMDSTNFNTGQSSYYDAAGLNYNDGRSQYWYDGEGRICEVMNSLAGTVTAYIYDADGQRVAKGTADWKNCDPSSNHFVVSTDYVLGPSGEQVTEVSASNGWAHTNAWAGSMLLATYDVNGLHFYLTDPLGSRRAQTDYAGVVEQTCQNLPFGDGETCSANSPTENLFTGKERDSESGNDYFGARYYASTMGRFLSPDPSQLYFANPADPQSLNLYSYGRNNPLINIDPTGMDCVYDDGNGNFHTATGDCDNSTEALANAGHYIDCDGCTTNSTGGTLDPTTGTMYLTDANGKGISETNISDWADPQGVSTNVNVGGATYDVYVTGYGGNFYIPMGAVPQLPNGALAARHTSFWGDNAAFQWLMKWGPSIGCGSGLDAENVRPFEGKADAPKDSTDSTKETQGQGTIYGPKKRGGVMPYNNPEAAENIRTGLDAAGAIKNGIDCFQSINHQ